MRRSRLVRCAALVWFATCGFLPEITPRTEASFIAAELRSGFQVLPAQGADDLDELTRQFNQLYREGRFQEAARVGERALRAAEKSYGVEHVKVAEVLDALGVTYNALKDYKKALPLIERAIAIYKRTPGEESKEMVKALNTLAMNYAAQEKFAEAQDTYERALAIAGKVLPPNDEMVATLYNNRGQLYNDQDQYKEAAADYERALDILEKDQGNAYWDPRVALTMNNLAYVKKKLGDYDDAMMLYERSLKILERGVGRDNPDHPYIAAVLENLAALYELKGWKEEAQEAAARAKRIRAVHRN
ncbi:MAG TPA: tetratricopeptide repeat protein [Acidobacteriota bacterium]